MQSGITSKKKKIVLVGTGMVGMSYCYALLNQRGVCDELVLVDLNRDRAIGEAMDLNHGIAFSGSNMKIYAGGYDDCHDADIVTIAAGVAQKPGESRINLLNRNAQVFKTIIDKVIESGFKGCFLIATNPVDIMSYVTLKLSNFEKSKVIGSGTALDTARLRYLMGGYFNIDPRNVHAYVFGEHGDSEFVPWSQAKIATIPAIEYCERMNDGHCRGEMEKIAEEVKGAAQSIIAGKGATYYGIGMALVRISRAILSDENFILTVSAFPNGEYGLDGICVGLPTIVNRQGAKRIIELDLNEEEKEKLRKSHSLLQELGDSLTI